MPIYEYSCANCHGRFQKLVAGFSGTPQVSCPRCGSADIQKAVSRFAVMQSEETRLEALADPATFGGLDENDPASVARWAKQMGKAMGDDLGEDWDQVVDEMLDEELGGGAPGGDKGEDLGWG